MMKPSLVDSTGRVLRLSIQSETCPKEPIGCDGKKFIWTIDPSVLDGYQR